MVKSKESSGFIAKQFSKLFKSPSKETHSSAPTKHKKRFFDRIAITLETKSNLKKLKKKESDDDSDGGSTNFSRSNEQFFYDLIDSMTGELSNKTVNQLIELAEKNPDKRALIEKVIRDRKNNRFLERFTNAFERKEINPEEAARHRSGEKQIKKLIKAAARRFQRRLSKEELASATMYYQSNIRKASSTGSLATLALISVISLKVIQNKIGEILTLNNGNPFYLPETLTVTGEVKRFDLLLLDRNYRPYEFEKIMRLVNNAVIQPELVEILDRMGFDLNIKKPAPNPFRVIPRFIKY